MQELAERYIAAFNETDPTRRRTLLEQVFTSDGTYTDPNHELTGVEAIDVAMAEMQENNPGLRFSLHGPVDSHHDQARFQWYAGTPAQPQTLLGFDVIVTSEGRIEHVYGFVDAQPAA